MNPVQASLRQAHTPGLSPVDGLPAGHRLQNVEIECVLARSSGAVVYRGLDLVRTSPVVIKEFLPTGLVRRGAEHGIMLCEGADASVFERARQAFVAEGHLLQRCRHPSLMRVLQVLEQNGTAYRVMPHCPGPSLLEFRRNMAEAPTEKLLRNWLEDLLGALAELHAAGRVHGAVAPRNILVLPGDRLLLLDSNAVSTTLVSDQTRSMIAALPPCVAPREQTEPGLNRLVGPWTDLYSLAATLHFCMTGDVCGTTDRGKWPRLPKSLSASAPRTTSPHASHSVGPAWLAALSTCLAENPEDRPQSVSQLRRLFDIEQLSRPVAPAVAAPGLAPPQTGPGQASWRCRMRRRSPEPTEDRAIRPMSGRPFRPWRSTCPSLSKLRPRAGAAALVGPRPRPSLVCSLRRLPGPTHGCSRRPASRRRAHHRLQAPASRRRKHHTREALAAPTKTAAVQDATPTSERQIATPVPAAIAAQSAPIGATRPAPSRSRRRVRRPRRCLPRLAGARPHREKPAAAASAMSCCNACKRNARRRTGPSTNNACACARTASSRRACRHLVIARNPQSCDRHLSEVNSLRRSSRIRRCTAARVQRCTQLRMPRTRSPSRRELHPHCQAGDPCRFIAGSVSRR